MLTLDEVVEIYRSHGLEISEADAAAELEHASAGGADYSTIVFRINCYAREQARTDYADACDANEHQENYE